MRARVSKAFAPKIRDTKDENALLDAAISGDPVAFSRLYTRYVGQIQAFCMRLLQGKTDVEDAVQQVFLEAWRSLYRFERRSLFSTWLTKIAIHTCLSFYRKSGRTVLSFGDDADYLDQMPEPMWTQSSPSPDENVWIGARKQAVHKILGRMKQKKRVVFAMSDMHGMSAPEISGVLGVPDATIRTRLFHARREFIAVVRKSPHYRTLLQEEKKATFKAA